VVTAKWWEAVGEINKMSKADGVGSIRRAKGRRRFLRVLSKAGVDGDSEERLHEKGWGMREVVCAVSY
jgi:hypothetical protein